MHSLKVLALDQWGFSPSYGDVNGGLPNQTMAFLPLEYIIKLFELPADPQILTKLVTDNWKLYPQARKTGRFPMLIGSKIYNIVISNLEFRINDQVRYLKSKRGLSTSEAIKKVMVPAVWVRHLVEFYMPKLSKYCNNLWEENCLTVSYNDSSSFASSKQVAESIKLLLAHRAMGLQTRWLPDQSKELVKETASKSGVMFIMPRGAFTLVSETQPAGFSLAWSGSEKVWIKPVKRAAA